MACYTGKLVASGRSSGRSSAQGSEFKIFSFVLYDKNINTFIYPLSVAMLGIRSLSLIIFLLFRSLSSWLKNNNRFKWRLQKISTTLVCVVLLEIFWNYILMYHCFPIHGKSLYFFLKVYDARISECNIIKCSNGSKNWGES